VDLFFVLSGFLITGILLDSRRRPHYFRNFYARRALRIFPLYYGVLIFVLALPAVLGAASVREALGRLAGQGWYWVYLTDVAVFFGRGVSETHFWSLAVEEQFYLLWPLVVYLCSRRALVITCVLVALTAMAMRFTLAANGMDTYFLTCCRMDGLACGALLAVAARAGGLRRLLPVARWLPWGLMLLLLPLYFATTGASIPLLLALKYTLLAGLYACLLTLGVCAGRGTLVHWFLTGRVLRAFGKYSYGLYVIHGLLGSQFESWFPLDEGTALPFVLAAAVRVAGATGVSFALAWLSWHLYEKQFLKLKRFVA
jgi:peptidoglycan/LPS O-acetylase OafA/YrhL